MKSLTIPAIAVLLVASVQAGPSEKEHADNRAALGQKVLGAWEGRARAPVVSSSGPMELMS